MSEAATIPQMPLVNTAQDIEERGRIFEPFYTAKTAGNGAGPGLSFFRGIVQRHRGKIDGRAEPGRETGRKVNLPSDEACGTDTPVEMAS